MVPHLGLSFPFGPADGLGGHFQKPLGSQNPDLESWNVETVSAWGSAEVAPLARGTNGGSGRSRGQVASCVWPGWPHARLLDTPLPQRAFRPAGSAGSCLLPRRLGFLSGPLLPGLGAGLGWGGAASGWPVVIATLASRRELCGEQPWGSNRWRARRKTYLRLASVHEAWHLSAWIGGG